MSARSAFYDPLDLYRLIEDTDSSNSSQYRVLLETTKQRVLKEHGNQAERFAEMLDQIDTLPALVEDAVRAAGFVAGFNACRQLLVNGTDILKGTDLKAAKPKGRAR